MQRNYAFKALGLSLLAAAGASQAADLPTHKAPPAPIVSDPALSWTGPYLGLQGGYAWDGEQVAVPLITSIPYSVERHGGFGGVVGGYNYQIGNLVIGAEAEYNVANVYGGAAVLSTYITTNRVTSFGSVDARIGYAFNRLLVYGVGGLGLISVNHTVDVPLVAFGGYGSYNAFEPGYNVGGGVQYAFTNNWSGFVEYRYYNSGAKDFSSLAGIGPHHTIESLSNVRFGIAYRFGG